MSNNREDAARHPCLVVEDSSFDQRMIMRVANKGSSKLDYRVASTIAEARTELTRHDFSVILLDNNLPDGKGANFALELAEHDVWSKIPIIMISDWPSPFMVPKAKAAGVSFIVNKSDFMPNLVDHVLARRQHSVH